MGLEEIINQILSSRSDIKREKILEMIENKKGGAGDYLTDETAARISASELGVKIVKKPMRVVLWDDKVDLVESGKIQREQTIRISHGYVREGLDGKPELHMGNKANIKILTDSTKKLVEITETGGPITVEGTVTIAPVLREVTTSRNEKVTVASFQLSDATGKLKVSAWRNIAKAVKGLTVGTRIKMRNIYAKKGYEHVIELSSRYSTSVEVLSAPEN